MMNQREKKNQRRSDRYWAADVFCPEWRNQYQLHHDWKNGGWLYFLTPEDHRLKEAEIRQNGG